MCLILVADTARPAASEIQEAHLSNSDGIGIAYRKPDDRLITWEKGLDVDAAIALTATLPLPFVVHFRWATHGGISPLLCHPFPVSRNVGITLTGHAKELLFHNGIWDEYIQFEHRAGLRGPVSDTRIMAYVLWREGEANREGVALQIADRAGKLALFAPDGITRYGNWHEGDDLGDTTKGCYYSNLNHCWSAGWQGHSCQTTSGPYIPTDPDWRRCLPAPVETPTVDVEQTFECPGCRVEFFLDTETCYLDHQPVCEDCWDFFCDGSVRSTVPPTVAN